MAQKSVNELTAQSIKDALHLTDGIPAVAYLSVSKDGVISRRVTEQGSDFSALANARTMAYKMRDAKVKDFVGILWSSGVFTLISTDVPTMSGGAVEI